MTKGWIIAVLSASCLVLAIANSRAQEMGQGEGVLCDTAAQAKEVIDKQAKVPVSGCGWLAVVYSSRHTTETYGEYDIQQLVIIGVVNNGLLIPVDEKEQYIFIKAKGHGI